MRIFPEILRVFRGMLGHHTAVCGSAVPFVRNDARVSLPMGCLVVALATCLLVPELRAEDSVRAVYREDLASAIDQQVKIGLPRWVDYYKELHANPELSLQEKESAKRIAKHLGMLGYDVTPHVGGHGVVGIFHNGDGPTVLVRGDMDALPIVEETNLPYRSQVTVEDANGTTVGVMHACGHDIHQTCLVATAEMLMAAKDVWRGTLFILAQPAEEIGKGARMMIEDGLFERFPRPDYCLALHVASDQPAGQIGYTSGWALANVDSVDITIHGKGGHGSQPNQTIDPVVAAAHVVVALQTIVSRRVDPIEPAVITVGSIHSGSKHNIISNSATMQLTVRSYTQETRKVLLDGIRRVTKHTARAMGCAKDPDVVVRDQEFTPATYNDPPLVAATIDVLGKVVGGDNVFERRARMGGEDFGRYPSTLKVPGFLFWLGSVHQDFYKESLEPNGPTLPPLHSSKYAPDPIPTIRTGVRCMTHAVLALFDPAG